MAVVASPLACTRAASSIPYSLPVVACGGRHDPFTFAYSAYLKTSHLTGRIAGMRMAASICGRRCGVAIGHEVGGAF